MREDTFYHRTKPVDQISHEGSLAMSSFLLHANNYTHNKVASIKSIYKAESEHSMPKSCLSIYGFIHRLTLNIRRYSKQLVNLLSLVIISSFSNITNRSICHPSYFDYKNV